MLKINGNVQVFVSGNVSSCCDCTPAQVTGSWTFLTSSAWVAPRSGFAMLQGCGGGGGGSGGGGGGAVLQNIMVPIVSGTSYWAGIGEGGTTNVDGSSTTFSVSGSTLLTSFMGAGRAEGLLGGANNSVSPWGTDEPGSGGKTTEGGAGEEGQAGYFNVYPGGAGLFGGGGGGGPYGPGADGGAASGLNGGDAAPNSGAGGGGALNGGNGGAGGSGQLTVVLL